MEIYVGLCLGVLAGLILGYLFGKSRATKAAGEPEAEQRGSEPEWWEVRKTLTGTQLQILQHLEAKKESSITQLQEKFSFIPDRELYYRLEQIVLMNFVTRDRKDGGVVYTLNPEYSGTVEDDKTVILTGG